jgi:hypothetical protein
VPGLGGGAVAVQARRRGRSVAHRPEPAEDAVQAAEEQRRGLAGPDDAPEREARGVVEEDQRDALAPPGARAKLLAVGEDHHHPVRVREPPLIGLVLGRHAAQRQAQAPTRALLVAQQGTAVVLVAEAYPRKSLDDEPARQGWPDYL